MCSTKPGLTEALGVYVGVLYYIVYLHSILTQTTPMTCYKTEPSYRQTGRPVTNENVMV
jgi:hypothetical protein